MSNRKYTTVGIDFRVRGEDGIYKIGSITKKKVITVELANEGKNSVVLYGRENIFRELRPGQEKVFTLDYSMIYETSFQIRFVAENQQPLDASGMQPALNPADVKNYLIIAEQFIKGECDG